jgi:hypothetical protein
MQAIKKISSYFLSLGALVYLLVELFHIVYSVISPKYQRIETEDLVLLAVVLVLSLVVFKRARRPEGQLVETTFLGVLWSFLAPFIILGIPMAWYDINNGNMFSGLGSYIYAIGGGIITLILSIMVYGILRSFGPNFVVKSLSFIYFAILLVLFTTNILGEYNVFNRVRQITSIPDPIERIESEINYIE